MSYITHETSKSTKCSTQSSSVAVKIGKIQRKVPGYICNTTTGLVFRMISKFRNNSLRPDLLLCSCCTAIGPTNVRIGPRMRSRKSWRTQTMSKHPSYAAYCMVSSNSGPLTPPSFDGGSPRRPLDDATIRRRRRSRATHTPEHHADGPGVWLSPARVCARVSVRACSRVGMRACERACVCVCDCVLVRVKCACVRGVACVV